MESQVTERGYNFGVAVTAEAPKQPVDCPVNRLDCAFDTYEPKRPPKEDCAICWAKYNLKWGLPIENRTARSSFKAKDYKHGAWWNRRLPDLSPLFDERPRNLVEAIREDDRDWNPLTFGLDVSTTATGMTLVVELDDSLCVAGRTIGFKVGSDASIDQRLNRFHKIIKYFIDLYSAVSRQGEVDVLIEDHAHAARGYHSTELRELNGAIKFQYYIQTGRPIEPVNNTSARKEVFGTGSADKADIEEALKRQGWQWFDEWTDDEMDALAVALTPIARQPPRSIPDVIEEQFN